MTQQVTPATLEQLDRAVAARPDDAGLRYNRATVLRFLGRFDQAEADLDRAIRAAPHDWEAIGLRSGLRRQTPQSNHVTALRKMLQAGLQTNRLPWPGEVQLRHALAKELDDLGLYDESFAELAAGAALRRAHLLYDFKSDVAVMDAIRATMTQAWLQSAPPGDGAPAPIFIIGLPRSGTTLVERIVASHPDVTGLGELNDFPAALITCAAAAGAGPGTGKRALVDIAARLSPAELGRTYLARIARHDTPGHVTDKLPSNTLYAGLIAAALPRARLVWVQRHPMANGFGMFRTLFNQGYPFSYDQRELGRYMGAHARLMAHWAAILGDRLITISYERLVADQAGQTRALLASLGLPWDDACLQPHRNQAASLTQSAVQVRAPVHADAVDHWRHYAPGLAPLAAILRAEDAI